LPRDRIILLRGWDFIEFTFFPFIFGLRILSLPMGGGLKAFAAAEAKYPKIS
jgi:hypothetical protein